MDEKVQRKILVYLGVIVLCAVAGFIVSMANGPQYPGPKEADKPALVAPQAPKDAPRAAP